MTRSVRLLVAIAMLGGLFTAPAAIAGAQAETNPARGFSQIAGCISGAHNLLVSLVVDESLSLRQTDPQAMRVQGITTAIDSLQQLTESADQSLNVEMNMSTFARSYRPLVGWRRLTPESAQTLRTTAQRELPARDAGNATDYRQALLGAKRQLDSRQRQLNDPNACKVVLWFTDGALDVDTQTAVAAQQLCQAGGIADAVRNDGIAVVALALFTPGAGVSQSQRDRLQALAEGRGGGTTCGHVPIPSDSAAGVYLPANDPAALQRLFAGAGALVAGGTEVGTFRCPSGACPHGQFPLDIDPGVAGARVLVQSAGRPKVTIISPSGKRLRLSAGWQQKVDGAQVSYLERDHLATINVDFSPYAKSRSLWRIEPSGPSDLNVYWFWGAKVLPAAQGVRAGATTQLTFQVEDENGNPLPGSPYRSVIPTIRVGGRRVPARVTPAGILTARVRLGTDGLPAHMPVTASLSALTKPSGVRLGPITVSQKLPVTLPPAYPQVEPGQLDFGRLEGLGSAKSQLNLIGSQLGSTSICFTGSNVTVPGGHPRRDLISEPSGCVKLKRDERKTVSLELTPKSTADGVASGQVNLRMTAADGSKDVTMHVPTTLDMARKVNQGMRWALVLALLALALLLPALMLVGSNLVLARFVRQSTSRTAAKPVRITPSGLQSIHGAELLEPEDFDYATFSGTRKGGRMPIEGTGITLAARRIFSLRPPQGVATVPHGQFVVSSTVPYRRTAPNEAPATLGEVDAAFLVMDAGAAARDDVEGTLVVVVPVDVDREGIHERARRFASAPPWDKLLAEAAEYAETRATESVTTATSRSPSVFPSSSRGPSAPSSTWEDEAPKLPWDDDPGPEARKPEPSKQGGFRVPRKSREKPSRAAPADPPPGRDDDDLPPIPDFLR